MANFLFKLILLGGIIGVGYMVYTGNMGGAKNATQNYNDVMLKGKHPQQK